MQKIDNFLDTKTRVIEQLDRANIEKNKQWDIKSPVPIKDFQTLITAVVSPKIRSLGNIANDLTTGVLTTITAFSGSSSGNGNPNAGLGNVVSKFLSFSGPILQGSSGGTGGLAGVTTPARTRTRRAIRLHRDTARPRNESYFRSLEPVIYR